MNLVQASQFVPSIFMAQEPQTPSRHERRKVSVEFDLVLDPDESVQNHRAAIVEIDFEGIETWVLAGIRLVAINLE